MPWGDTDIPAFGESDREAFAVPSPFGEQDAPAFGEGDADAFGETQAQRRDRMWAEEGARLKANPFGDATASIRRAEGERQAILARRQAEDEAAKAALPPAMPREQRPGIGEQFGHDVARGVDQLQGIGYGLTALGADGLGADRAADWAIEGYKRNMEEAKANPPVIGTYRNISTESPGEFAGDLGRYAAEAVGENVLMSLPSLATGGVGALVARKSAEKVAEALAADLVAKGVAKEVAAKQAAQMVGKRMTMGGLAGAYPSAAGLEAGSIYGDILDETGQRRPGVAAVGGLAAGVFDILPEAMIFARALGPRLGEQMTRSLVRRLGVEGAKQFMVEAPTEAIQTVIERASVAHVDPTKEVFSRQGVDDIVDSFLKGGFAGGALGIGSEAIGSARQALEDRRRGAAEVTVAPPAPPADFAPSADWQEVQSGAVLPPGLDIRVDMASGRRWARIRPEAAPEEKAPQPAMDLAAAVADPRPAAEIAAETEATRKDEAKTRDKQALAAFGQEKGARVTMQVGDQPAETVTFEDAWTEDDGSTWARVRLDDGTTYVIMPGEASFAPIVGDGTREAPVQATSAAHVDEAARQADPEPTPSQKEAGNYRKGHLSLHGLDIAIETPKGSTRTGIGADGRPWSSEMVNHYGYVKHTAGADGDQVDVFVGSHPETDLVVVIDQIDPATGKFDEHKAILGASDPFDALDIYEGSFSDGSGPDRRGAFTAMSVAEFKEWLAKGDTRKPLSWKPAQAPVAASAFGENDTPATFPETEDTNASAAPVGAFPEPAAAPPEKSSPTPSPTPPAPFAVHGRPKPETQDALADTGEAQVDPAATEPVSDVDELPSAPPAFGRKASGKPKAGKVPILDALAAYFQPGRVVPAYGGGHDRVIAFERGSGPSGWQVRVIESDKEGNPVPGAQERTHATEPFRSYRQAEQWYLKNVRADEPVTQQATERTSQLPARKPKAEHPRMPTDAEIAAAVEQDATKPINDMMDVAAQETAKRALEIAAVGEHPVAMFGDGVTAQRQLREAFRTIGGNESRIGDRGEISIEILPTPPYEIMLPPPGERSADIVERVYKARDRLADIKEVSGDATRLLNEARNHNFVLDDQVNDIIGVARTIAAMDGARQIGRIHLAEALSYHRVRKAEPEVKPTSRPQPSLAEKPPADVPMAAKLPLSGSRGYPVTDESLTEKLDTMDAARNRRQMTLAEAKAAKAAQRKAIDDLAKMQEDPVAEWNGRMLDFADAEVRKIERPGGKAKTERRERDAKQWREGFADVIEESLTPAAIQAYENYKEPRGGNAYAQGVRAAIEWLKANPRPEGPDEVNYTATTSTGRKTTYVLRNDARSIGEVKDNLASRPPQAFYALRAIRALRTAGIPAEADPPLYTFRNDQPLKRHPDYRAAKGGDREAAARLVADLVKDETVAEAARRFGPDAVYVPVIAEEASGRNEIPGALARFLAEATGAERTGAIVQSNRAFHTGAGPMERLIARPAFDGKVEAGKYYVLVDDVAVLGGSLAELANHIRSQGGEVAGVVTLVNASRSGVLVPKKAQFSEIERRYGDVVRDEFGVEPAAITADEAAYILNFRDADALRDRVAKARGERERRLLQKGLRAPAPDQGGVEPPSSDTADDDGKSFRLRAGFEPKQEAVFRDLRGRLDQLGLKGVRLKTPPVIRAEFGGKTYAADGYYWNRLIAVALDTGDKAKTLDHEAVHALRRLDLFSGAEWQALSRQAAGKWRTAYGIDALYGGQGLTGDQMNEEAIAHAFAAWRAGEMEVKGGLVLRTFNKILRFLEALANALRGRGFQSWEDVFERIGQGEIGTRDAAEMERLATPADLEHMSAQAAYALRRGGKAEGAVPGENLGLAPDAGLFARWFIHPRTIAAFHRHFVPVYRTAVKQFEARDEIAATLSRIVEPYMVLAPESKRKVNAALELGRLQGTVIRTNRLVAIENMDQDMASLSKPGETIRLNEVESAAYKAVREAMDTALDLFKTQVIRERGFDPEAAGTAREIETMAKAAKGDEKGRLLELARVVREIEQAKRQGYVPFQRWGQVGVIVRERISGNEVPETAYFEMVEVDGLLDKAKRKMGLGPAEFGRMPEVKVVLDRVKTRFRPEDGYEIEVFQVPERTPMAGQVNMADLDMLAQVGQIDETTWESVRQNLETAVQKRGFRSHFFGARNIPGYSGDFERAIADYVVGISGYMARRRFAGTWEKSIDAIPRTMPRLKEYAQKYHAYVQNPAEEFQMLRQVGFVYYLAGSIATAVVNMTQVPIITAPYLTQFHGKAGVARELARAYKDAMAMLTRHKGMDLFDPAKAPSDMQAPLRHAWDQGFFVPLNTWEVMGLAHNRMPALRGLSKKARTAVDTIAIMFTMAERLNRLVTFIAAYRMARNPAVAAKVRSVLRNNALARSDELLRGFTPEKFAEWAIDETHYRMGKVNRPTVMRGAGAALLQFKGFVMQTLELFYRLLQQNGREGKVALALTLLLLVAVSGLWGLPFMEDYTDLMEAIYKRIKGLDHDEKAALREVIVDLTGSPKLAEAFARGGGRLAGVDLTRIGMGKVVPHTMEEVGGIPFSMTLGRAGQALDYAKHGQGLLAFAELMPQFIKNPMHALAWGSDGIRSQATGKVVIPAEKITAADQMLKAIGFTPGRIANQREAEFAQNRANRAASEVKAQFYGDLARHQAQAAKAERAKDTAALRRAETDTAKVFQDIAKFNEGRPEHEQIKIDRRALRDRVREEIMGAETRDKKAPKQARARRQRIEDIFGVSP
jgi:hypothetical protein